MNHQGGGMGGGGAPPQGQGGAPMMQHPGMAQGMAQMPQFPQHLQAQAAPAAAQGGGGGAGGPPMGMGMQQQPSPAPFPGVFEFLPGVASLMEDLDKKVLVTLRDGRHFVGMMRSFDQYGNVMLEDTYERHIIGNQYADERLGLYVIRGENLVLLGQLDMEKEEAQTVLREVPLDKIMAQRAAQKQEKAEDELLRKKLQQQSLGLGGLGFDDYL